MSELLWVVVAGGLGSGGRHMLTTLIQEATSPQFPFGTLAVNVLGCFAIGLAGDPVLSSGWIPPAARVPVVTGFLGGFTTYSAFGGQTLALAQSGATGQALAYVAATTALGFAAVWLGLALGRAVR